MSVEVFGRILVASQIEAAATDTLQKWFPTYLREIESQLALQDGFLGTPRNYTRRNKYEDVGGEEFPKVVILSPGLQGAPTKSGKLYRATWRLGVGVALAAPTEEEADMMVKCYGAATRAILVQNGSLGGLGGVVETVWVDESYDDLPITAVNQLYKISSNWFTVDVENVIDRMAGASSPDDTTTVYGEVETVHIDLVKEAIN